jgi:simple sugar transport system substrate-binding protein
MNITSRTTRIAVAGVIAAAASLVAVAPTATATPRRITIAVITHGDNGSFWSVAKKGALAAGRALRITVDYQGANNDLQKQAQLIDAAVTKKVDGIAISLPSATALQASVRRAIAAGIPVITLNSGENDFKALGAITHVGQDESVAGAGAGEKLKAAGAKSLLCVIHEQGNSGLEQRCNGAKTTFGGTVEVLYVKGKSDINTTSSQISAKLSAKKTIDAVLTLDPDIAMAAAAAIKTAGSTAKLATFDMSGPVVAAIKAGTVLFAVDQQQYLQGYLAVTFLYLNITNANTVGGGLPVMTGPGFVDKTNVKKVEALAKAGSR